MPFQICRVCYKRGYDFLSLEDSAHKYEQKLSSCIPEIDIYIIDNPGICQMCAYMLDTAFELRNICLDNEKRYNSAFNETIDKSVLPNQVIDSSNENPVDKNSTHHTINKIDEGENLLSVIEIRSEPTIICSICNKNFSSSHDKKLHDFKLHRQLQHKSLKRWLSPIDKNLNKVLIANQQNINSKTKLIHENADSNVENILENLSPSNVNENQNNTATTCIESNTECTSNYELELHKSSDLKKCHVCAKTFNKESELNNHVKLHLIECCGEAFSTATLLQLHTYREHNMTCGICNEHFMQFGPMFNHLLDHIKYWNKCHVCRRQFKINDDFNKHICESYQCTICNMTYFTVETFTEHRKTHQKQVKNINSTKTKDIICKKCNIYYKTRGLFMQHYFSAHYHNRKRSEEKNFDSTKVPNEYTCYLCGRKYKLHIQLKLHILQQHCNKILTIPIVDCQKDKFYRDQEGLHINFDIPPYYLTQPKTADISKNKFIMRTKRICFVCRILFNRLPSLHLHVRNEHFSCCDKEFKYVDGFLQHNFTHFDQEEKDGEHAEILCLGCKRKFKNYIILIAHCCDRIFTKSEIGSKKKTILETIEEWKSNNKQCSIELHEDYEPDTSECVTHESNNSLKKISL